LSPAVFLLARRDPFRCTKRGDCEALVPCPGGIIGDESACPGCGACSSACPEGTIELIEWPAGPEIGIVVNDERVTVPSRITVLHAPEILGFTVSRMPGDGVIFAPCRTGGCWSCTLLVDGRPAPSCVTAVREGMTVETSLPAGSSPLHPLYGWMGHSVGGVGTPWHLKNAKGYIEAAVFACGCNLRCPQCQNWTTTYHGKVHPFPPLRLQRP